MPSHDPYAHEGLSIGFPLYHRRQLRGPLEVSAHLVDQIYPKFPLIAIVLDHMLIMMIVLHQDK